MCSEKSTWRNLEVLLVECWFEVCSGRSFCSMQASGIKDFDTWLLCSWDPARSTQGHMLVDPSVCSPHYAKIVLYGRGARPI